MAMEENEERTTTDEDVEGHASKVREQTVRNTDEDDDVEGHGHTHVRGAEDGDDDVEGHAHTTTR